MEAFMRFSSVMMFAAASLGVVSVASAKDAAPTTLAMTSGSFAPISDAQFSSAHLKARNRLDGNGSTIALLAGGAGLAAGLTIGFISRDTKTTCYNSRSAITPCVG
jgi:hypothetical protein